MRRSTLAKELGLGGEFKTAIMIAHCICEQVVPTGKRTSDICGSLAGNGRRATDAMLQWECDVNFSKCDNEAANARRTSSARRRKLPRRTRRAGPQARASACMREAWRTYAGQSAHVGSSSIHISRLADVQHCKKLHETVAGHGPTTDDGVWYRKVVENRHGKTAEGLCSTNIARTIESLQHIVHGVYPPSACAPAAVAVWNPRLQPVIAFSAQL
ncbi:hypothetical protein P692DRAFT_20821420 [Suillus brevipes Sb2]|nr:hypothetical protein P692DRAFT_20821420 [Suillus brevipes Sb2]